MASVPQTYTISDFIEWNNKKQLILDPEFQRGSVWSDAAKVYLIDTILNDFPMPQVYFRTKVDSVKQTTIREVVDGQQRLRAILDFAAGKIRLTSKASNYEGKYYATLDPQDQENFLAYKVPVVQLLNATNEVVLEVFARLNSYSVKVTPAELRHAEYSEAVKWAIYDATKDWSRLWEPLHIVSVRDSVRLKNTSVMAEMFMALDVGFGDGGEQTITKYYKKHKAEGEIYFQRLRTKVDLVLREILSNTEEEFLRTTFYDSPNFLALFVAVAYLKGYVPETRTTEEIRKFRGAKIDWILGKNNLRMIAQAFDFEDGEGSSYAPFILASKSTTHRIASRKIRLQYIVKALIGDEA